jgi:hypothetical protein
LGFKLIPSFVSRHPDPHTMSASYDSRDSAHSTTSQLLFGLLFGNVIAVLGVIAFRPYPAASGSDREAMLIFAVLGASLVAASLLFLASAVRRRRAVWWIVTLALNVTQIARLVPAAIVIGVGSEGGGWAPAIWTFLFVPFFGLLAAVGIVMTLRAVHRSRRRRLARAA